MWFWMELVISITCFGPRLSGMGCWSTMIATVWVKHKTFSGGLVSWPSKIGLKFNNRLHWLQNAICQTVLQMQLFCTRSQWSHNGHSLLARIVTTGVYFNLFVSNYFGHVLFRWTTLKTASPVILAVNPVKKNINQPEHRKVIELIISQCSVHHGQPFSRLISHNQLGYMCIQWYCRMEIFWKHNRFELHNSYTNNKSWFHAHIQWQQ